MARKSSILDWVVRHAWSIRPYRKKAWRNPRPKGAVCKGSGTERILVFLRTHPEQWFLRCELRDALAMSDGRTGWALRRLVTLGLIEQKWVWHIRRRAVLCYRLRS